MGPLTDLPLGIFGVNLLSSGYNGFNEVIKSDFKGCKIRQELTNFLALEEKHQAHNRRCRRRVEGSKPTPPSFTRAVRNPLAPSVGKPWSSSNRDLPWVSH